MMMYVQARMQSSYAIQIIHHTRSTMCCVVPQTQVKTKPKPSFWYPVSSKTPYRAHTEGNEYVAPEGGLASSEQGEERHREKRGAAKHIIGFVSLQGHSNDPAYNLNAKIQGKCGQKGALLHGEMVWQFQCRYAIQCPPSSGVGLHTSD